MAGRLRLVVAVHLAVVAEAAPVAVVDFDTPVAELVGAVAAEVGLEYSAEGAVVVVVAEVDSALSLR